MNGKELSLTRRTYSSATKHKTLHYIQIEFPLNESTYLSYYIKVSIKVTMLSKIGLTL